MKVLFVAKNIPLPSGHKENPIIINQAKAIKKTGVELDFIYPKEFLPSWLKYITKNTRVKAQLKLNKEFFIDDLLIRTKRYFRLPIFSLDWFFLFVFGFLKKSSKKNNEYDVVHSHYIFPDLMISRCYKARKYFCTVRMGDIDQLNKSAINRFIFNRIKRGVSFIVPTLNIKEKLIELVGDENYEITVVPNCIDDIFYLTEKSTLNDREIDFLMVSSFIQRKNVEVILELSKFYSEKKIVLVGNGSSSYSDKLKLKIKECENLIYYEFVNKEGIIQLMDSSKNFILLSERETFGLVYAEALSRGCRVIGLDGEGLSGMIDGVFCVKDHPSKYLYNDALYDIDDFSEKKYACRLRGLYESRY